MDYVDYVIYCCEAYIFFHSCLACLGLKQTDSICTTVIHHLISSVSTAIVHIILHYSKRTTLVL